MATYEFTYKVPDDLWVNSFGANKTETAKVKLDDPVVKVYMTRPEGIPCHRMLGSSLGEHKTLHDFMENSQKYDNNPCYELTVDASKSDTEALACWLAKFYTTGPQSMDSDERPEMEFRDSAVPVLHNKTYKKLINPLPRDVWELTTKEASSDSIDFTAIFKGDMTRGEVNAFHRREEVRYYKDKYDLGSPGESDAANFITKTDDFMTKMFDVKPWMDDGTFHTLDSLAPPKIPHSVLTNIQKVEDINSVVQHQVGVSIDQNVVMTIKDQLQAFGASIHSQIDQYDQGGKTVYYSQV